jgi:chromosome segregation ATPase
MNITYKNLDKLQKQIEKLKTEKIQMERDIENIETEWKKQGINSLDEVKAKQKQLEEEIKKLESREENLLSRIKKEFDWENFDVSKTVT